MSAGAVRSGSAVKPVTVASGTDGSVTSPRRLEFRKGKRSIGARPVVVWNRTGGGRAIRVKLNATDALDFGGASDDGVGYFPVNDGAAVEVTMGSLVVVEQVSFVTTDAADDLDNVEVTGWLP